ncbi:MAG: 23S rRNA (adenine(2503)-C(2))-methyltransferase RlmN [Bacteroidetes bacterium]|nr:23S rRNA (adenine(2503)-C(2))-methyltransferase RlmN [Bacteroidota bacterium]
MNRLKEHIAKSIRNYSLRELEKLFVEWKEPKFRVKQLFNGLANPHYTSFSEIITLPKSLRERLESEFTYSSLTIGNKQVSEDGTIKYLFNLQDGNAVESVLIPSEMLVEDGTPKRLTICVSTQVGCALGCKFCATASLKPKRNLTVAEIVDQFMAVQNQSEQQITNLVFMGMGEPMLNYDNVMSSVDYLTSKNTNLLTAKHITISTAGIIPGIIRMADENRPIKLAISLHATTNENRMKLMPISKKYTLKEIGDAAEYYYRKTRKPITYEYILLEGINDTDLDVQRLAKICRRVPSKVNVIPFHAIDFTHPDGFAAELKPTQLHDFQRFIAKLRMNDVTVMIRSSSGEDIDAACGQLAFSTSNQSLQK